MTGVSEKDGSAESSTAEPAAAETGAAPQTHAPPDPEPGEPAVALLWDHAGGLLLSGVRARVRKLLAGLDEEALAGAVLVVNELATNALAHGVLPGECRLWVVPGGRLRVEVDDASSEPPRIVPHPPHDSGIGLRIVDHLATSWGHTPHPEAGKTIFAEIDLEPSHP